MNDTIPWICYEELAGEIRASLILLELLNSGWKRDARTDVIL